MVSNAFRLLGWVGSPDELVGASVRYSISLKRLSAFGVGWMLGAPKNDNRYQLVSQTPFGFGGGLDPLKIDLATGDCFIKSQTPFGFGGGLDGLICTSNTKTYAVVSNAFRLWGWVGSRRHP